MRHRSTQTNPAFRKTFIGKTNGNFTMLCLHYMAVINFFSQQLCCSNKSDTFTCTHRPIRRASSFEMPEAFFPSYKAPDYPPRDCYLCRACFYHFIICEPFSCRYSCALRDTRRVEERRNNKVQLRQINVRFYAENLFSSPGQTFAASVNIMQ